MTDGELRAEPPLAGDREFPLNATEEKQTLENGTSGHCPGKACLGHSSQCLDVGGGFGQLMEWTGRGKGDFQPERFVPVKGKMLRLLLWCRELRAAGLALGASVPAWAGGMCKTSGQV